MSSNCSHPDVRRAEKAFTHTKCHNSIFFLVSYNFAFLLDDTNVIFRLHRQLHLVKAFEVCLIAG